MSLLANSNAIESGGYNIDRSLRFRSSASAYLSRTPASAGNQTTWTYSAWLKVGALGVAGSGRAILRCYNGTTDSTWSEIRLGVNNAGYYDSIALDGYATNWRITNAQFRDPSAWYHIVVVWDTTNATAANRVRIYVNGVQQTSFQTSNDPALNATGGINQSAAHVIGSGLSQFYDGYLAEVNFIDGQALTPSSFGQFDAVTGVWTPKKYTGTYGTNGFYLPFSDNTSATTLAYDKSGNGNNWTPNNISTTAGATYDSMTDVPTLTSATAANYCVLNPLDYYGSVANASGNLQTTLSAVDSFVKGTMAIPTSGKYYWEVTCASLSGSGLYEIGVIQTQYSTGNSGYLYSYTYVGNGNKRILNSYTAYGSSYTTNDVIGVAFDADAGSITFYKNNVSQGAATTGITAQCSPMIYLPSSATATSYYANFGQRPFSYTPPTGFKALNTFNLPDPTIKKPNQYMDATLYTGNGSTQTITNAAGFQPDLVWNKSRSVAASHELYDSVRGATNRICSNLTQAEDVVSGVTSFNATGYSLGSGTGSNSNGNTFVGWQWKKGATPGFDIVTYTGTGANRTIAHNLGVAPKFYVAKRRDSTSQWRCYHASLGYTYYINLNDTGSTALDSSVWNSAPTSSVFGLGTNDMNTNGATYVAYLFAEIAGFSKFGSYTGNGSTDGPFVYCGFRPKYVMIKNASAAADWHVRDTSRDPYNVADHVLYPNGSYAETSADGRNVDILSNGFKLRWIGGSQENANGNTYIFAAFAENPFKYSLAR